MAKMDWTRVGWEKKFARSHRNDDDATESFVGPERPRKAPRRRHCRTVEDRRDPKDHPIHQGREPRRATSAGAKAKATSRANPEVRWRSGEGFVR